MEFNSCCALCVCVCVCVCERVSVRVSVCVCVYRLIPNNSSVLRLQFIRSFLYAYMHASA
jgi:hypothetical protein